MALAASTDGFEPSVSRKTPGWLEHLRIECAARRDRLLEALEAARAKGDPAAYRRLIERWQRFRNIYGPSTALSGAR